MREATLGCGMHAANVLCVKVLAVEVVEVEVLVVFGVGGGRTEVAAPVEEFNVLRADVALPFVFGGEGGVAAVGCEGAWEWSVVSVGFDLLFCAGRGASGSL